MKNITKNARFTAVCIFLLMLVFCLALPVSALAAEVSSDDQPNSWRYENGQVRDNPVDEGGALLDSLTSTLQSNSQGKASLQANVLARGIDVSEWQGDINWQAVKNSGQVDFAIIRCGFAGKSSARADYKWERNVSECERLGIPYGVYVYSYATSWSDLNSLVQNTKSWLGSHKPSYPVFIDMEDSTIQGCGRSTLTAFAKSFCEQIESAGFVGGVYSSTYWYNNVLYGDQLDNYVKWVAQWNTTCTYSGNYAMWQYTSKGSVSGISGNVDMNYLYSSIEVNEARYKGVYDYDFYLECNPDVQRAYGGNRLQTFTHFKTYGMNEGRQASPMFDVSLYKELQSDCVRAYGGNNKQYYQHFLDYGMKEGRVASVVFDPYYYKSRYSDLLNAYGNDMKQYYLHFVNYGMNEGRTGSDFFEFSTYKNSYPDLTSAYGSDSRKLYSHFVLYGINEGRIACSFFDVVSYYNRYQDLRLAYKGDMKSYYKHYVAYGKREGRNATNCKTIQDAVTKYGGVNYSLVYDGAFYSNAYSDLRKAFAVKGHSSLIDDTALLEHFVYCGMNEGRQAKSSFRVEAYYNRYWDLRAAFRGNLKEYYMHYINYGKKEGRDPLNCDTLQDPISSYRGVNYSLVYDGNFYVNNYADLKKAYALNARGDMIDDTALVEHFVIWGMNEGRQAKKTFDVHSYYNEYPDLRAAFGKNWKYYYLHYIQHGYKEGRNTTGCNTLKG